MSRKAVDIVRAFQPDPGVDIVQLFARDADALTVDMTVDWLQGFFTDDFVCAFHALGSGERRGATGLREIWLDWLQPWESYTTGRKDFVEVGADRVLVLSLDYGRRHGLSDDVEMTGGALYSVRDGKIARIEFFPVREDAYAAAGLEPG